MATANQIKNFINEVAPCAQKAYRKLGKVYPSVCIGMACIESAYGTSTIMRKYNAFLGQKVGTGKTATAYWDGTFFKSKTKEEYSVGTHTVITDAFRSYKDMQQCVYNYYELLNSNVYKRVLANVPYNVQMEQIKLCGYMTSSTEVNSVLNLIRKYNLTRFDTVQAVDDYSEILPEKKYPTLRKGDRNEYVRAWQTFLNMNGYSCGANEGIFGVKTENAVKAWQSNHGLVPDGIIGKLTWGSLPII